MNLPLTGSTRRPYPERDVSPSRTWWLWRTERGGSCASRASREIPVPLVGRPGAVFHTRDRANRHRNRPPHPAPGRTSACATVAASFLLESVEHGRLGRYSLVGAGSRILDLAGAEALGEPVVGVAYDHAAALEPTVPLPDRGPSCRRAASSSPTSRPLRPRLRDRGGALRRPEGGRAAARRAARRDPERHRGGPLQRMPSRYEYERLVSTAKDHIRAGDAFQIVVSQRAERQTSAGAVQLYRSLRRVNPLLSLPARARRRPRPDRLLAGDAGQGRGPARLRQPDRGDDSEGAATATPSDFSPPRRTGPST